MSSSDILSFTFSSSSGLHVEAVALQPILGGDSLLLLFIVSLKLLGIIHHSLDFLLGQTALVVGDGYLVLLASALVTGRHIQDTIGINVECHLNLRNASWCRGDSSQVKLSKEMIVLSHCPLTLVHLDGDGRLVVGIGGESLGLLSGDGGVPLYEAGHHSSSSLNTERKRSDIEQEQVRDSLAGVSS